MILQPKIEQWQDRRATLVSNFPWLSKIKTANDIVVDEKLLAKIKSAIRPSSFDELLRLAADSISRVIKYRSDIRDLETQAFNLFSEFKFFLDAFTIEQEIVRNAAGLEESRIIQEQAECSAGIFGQGSPEQLLKGLSQAAIGMMQAAKSRINNGECQISLGLGQLDLKRASHEALVARCFADNASHNYLQRQDRIIPQAIAELTSAYAFIDVSILGINKLFGTSLAMIPLGATNLIDELISIYANISRLLSINNINRYVRMVRVSLMDSLGDNALEIMSKNSQFTVEISPKIMDGEILSIDSVSVSIRADAIANSYSSTPSGSNPPAPNVGTSHSYQLEAQFKYFGAIAITPPDQDYSEQLNFTDVRPIDAGEATFVSVPWLRGLSPIGAWKFILSTELRPERHLLKYHWESNGFQIQDIILYLRLSSSTRSAFGGI